MAEAGSLQRARERGEYWRCRAANRRRTFRFGGAYEKDTWYRRRRLPVCVRACAVRVCDHAVPKNRHASPTVVSSSTRPCLIRKPDDSTIRALAGHSCRDTVVALRVIAPHQPRACSGREIPPCTPASRMFVVVKMQSIIRQDSSSTPCLG